MRSPILLSATATVAPGAVAEFETTRLQNPFRTAMLIDEVRIFISGSTATTPITYGLGLDLKLGRVPLTKDYVPIANFGRALNDDPDPPGILIGQTTMSVLGPFTWRLPKPLYVPATEFLIPRIFNNPPYAASQTRTITIAYAGRSLDESERIPDVIDVPYVSYWECPVQTSGNQTPQQSTEADLVNPFNEPLTVQRFIGRCWGTGAQFPGGATIGTPDVGFGVGVRAANSNGVIMVKDSTPFPTLFSLPDRSWTVNNLLAPKGFFLFYLDFDQFGEVQSADIAPIISMVGYRKVRIQ